MKKFTRRAFAGLATAALAFASVATSALAADPIKVAFIEGLSGPFAATGERGQAEFEFAFDRFVNEKGGILDGRTIELVPFDNKTSPKESLIQLQVAIDQGIRYIIQGNSSGVANALTDAIRKHNRRNPDKKVLFINYSAVDPALTNDNCNFYHFRFDANADIKMDALTDVIAKDESIKKIYLIGQDYSFGKAVAKAATEMLKEKRPDIEIVGNELHPIGKVKDFTPYARKIQASGADAVITGNWGSDMVGLGKAVIESGFDRPIFTYYAAADGITKTLGEQGKGIVRIVQEGQLNPPQSDETAQYIKDFKAKYPNLDIAQPRISNAVQMLAKAIEEAGTADDVDKVAAAMEGMEMDNFWGGKLKMRAEDHQMIQDVHIMTHTDDVTFDFDNSGYGVKTESTVEAASADAPTTCKMRRPS